MGLSRRAIQPRFHSFHTLQVQLRVKALTPHHLLTLTPPGAPPPSPLTFGPGPGVGRVRQRYASLTDPATIAPDVDQLLG